MATFDGLLLSGVSGTIEFSQASPSDPVETCIDLHGLGGNAGGFHVHEEPLPQEARRRGRQPLPVPFTYDILSIFWIVIHTYPSSLADSAPRGGSDESFNLQSVSYESSDPLES